MSAGRPGPVTAGPLVRDRWATEDTPPTENLINQSIYRHKSGQALIVSVSQTMDQLAATWRPKALQRKMNAALGRWFTRQMDQQTNTNQNTALDQLRLFVLSFDRR